MKATTNQKLDNKCPPHPPTQTPHAVQYGWRRKCLTGGLLWAGLYLGGGGQLPIKTMIIDFMK